MSVSQLMHDEFMAAAPGDCGAPVLSPLLTSHPHPSWEFVSMSPLLSPINISLGRPELMGSLGAETPPSTPGRHRAR